jgi:hypothetical protein
MGLSSTLLNALDIAMEPPEHKAAIEEPAVSASGRPLRTKRPTWKILQALPQPPPTGLELLPEIDLASICPPPLTPSPFMWKGVRSTLNAFGLFREYPSVPTHNPDDALSLPDLTQSAPAESSLLSTPNSSRLSLAIQVGILMRMTRLVWIHVNFLHISQITLYCCYI